MAVWDPEENRHKKEQSHYDKIIADISKSIKKLDHPVFFRAGKKKRNELKAQAFTVPLDCWAEEFGKKGR